VLVRTRSGRQGSAVAIDCVGPGAGLPLAAARGDVGYAATDALVCLYPRMGMDAALTTERGTARDVIALISRALDRVERLAEARGGATLDARVASVIAVIAETSSPPHRRERLPIGLQQRDLARLAGVRHESFCRALGRLERSGIVRRETDGLWIRDHEALVSFGA
jgi:CRP-like cAMP-binding protein